MGYKDDLIRARDITASNYRQGKMSPYDDPFNDTYYDQEGWNKELTEAASKDDKIKYEEYLKRKNEQIRFIKEFNHDNINFLDCDYDNENYEELIKGLEKEPERGKRCYVCYRMRMEKTASTAKDNGYDYFCTTLSVSPYKNALWINEIGRELEDKYKVKWLYSDFKKKDGYKKSILLSQKYNLYRQNYCGCVYSKPQ